jgi:hypothetical protein
MKARLAAAVLAVAMVLGFGVIINLPKKVEAQSQITDNPCPQVLRITAQTTSTQLLTGNGANAIRICTQIISLGVQANATAQLVWGTGTTCGTGTVSAAPKLVQAASPTSSVDEEASGAPYIDYQPVRGQTNLCIIIASSGSVDGVLTYGLY